MKTIKHSLLTLFVTLSISTGSYGSTFTGEKLLDLCTSELSEEAFICLGYFWGMHQTQGMYVYVEEAPQLYCAEDVTTGQLKNVVVDYLEDHPEELDKYALWLIFHILGEAFPCDDGQ